MLVKSFVMLVEVDWAPSLITLVGALRFLLSCGVFSRASLLRVLGIKGLSLKWILLWSINFLSSSDSGKASHGSLITGIQGLLVGDWIVKLRHVYREGN